MSGLLKPPPELIVTRTPLRVSFVGGGTDLADFYTKEPGAVLSTAINRYVYVTVKRHSDLFFEAIRLNYSKSEQVNSIDEIENNISRECLRLLEIEPPVYVSTVGDVPASTGLGGSSAFTVGLLNALHAYRGERVTAGQLADEACHIEIDVLGEPIGKQDQYAAAFGGMNLFTFKPDGRVTVEHQRADNGSLRTLFGGMLMFWTGHQRDASGVLSEQRENTVAKFERLRRMRDQVDALDATLSRRRIDLREVGAVLHEGWLMKRELASAISNPRIDEWYERAMAAGAEGGKLCGAGGGGFLLFIVRPERHAAVRDALCELMELPVEQESHGSIVVTPFGR
jgi:D-glycero-alpha-D-manno-heptose-7-phosphate kinase